MPKGTGVDSSIADGTKAAKRKRGKYKKKENDSSNQSLLDALNDGTKSDSKLKALQLILQYGSARQKDEAMK